MNIYFVTLFCNNIFFFGFTLYLALYTFSYQDNHLTKEEIICKHTKLDMYTYILYLYCVLLKRKTTGMTMQREQKYIVYLTFEIWNRGIWELHRKI